MSALKIVIKSSIEWRTKPRYAIGARRPWTWGRVGLWLVLECGHCEQRKVSLGRSRIARRPVRVKCYECSIGTESATGGGT